MEKKTRSEASRPRSWSRRTISKNTWASPLPGELDRRHRLLHLGEAQAGAGSPRGRAAAGHAVAGGGAQEGLVQVAADSGEPACVVPQFGGKSADPEWDRARHGRLHVGVAGKRRRRFALRQYVERASFAGPGGQAPGLRVPSWLAEMRADPVPPLPGQSVLPQSHRVLRDRPAMKAHCKGHQRQGAPDRSRRIGPVCRDSSFSRCSASRRDSTQRKRSSERMREGCPTRIRAEGLRWGRSARRV